MDDPNAATALEFQRSADDLAAKLGAVGTAEAIGQKETQNCGQKCGDRDRTAVRDWMHAREPVLTGDPVRVHAL